MHAMDIFSDSYGGIFHIKVCGSDFVVVSDKDLMRQVLRSRPNTYTRSFNDDKILPFSGMLTTEGDEWKRNRRLGAPAFNDSNSAAMVPAMSKVTAKLISHLQHLADDSDGYVVWTPTRLLPLSTLDVLCATTFGIDFDFLDPKGEELNNSSKEVRQTIEDFLIGGDAALNLAILPWATRNRFPWNLNPMIRKLHTGVRRLRSTCEEIIGMRRAEKIRGESKERDDLLDKLMHLEKDDLHGNLIT
ncbi:hypothetical protein FOL47_009031 [Perkinsus chesapeaki]|uniref:Cytochrome P450 n=1 Tax=Perkinsus chesapeaki TaxID=330153 RepID=A0A7J6LAT0_PERCH|nr:hypothetical protein FOL47_009031 [Perkinsus chesapeaki]